MGGISKKVLDRLVDGIKRYQAIVESAAAKDVNEADTVTIVTDMLADVFGYQKFDEITAQFPIEHTKCDLAVRLDDQIKMLVEVKAVGHKLKDPHTAQAVNYAARSPVVKWVLLTNGHIWRAYSVVNEKPIRQDLVVEIDFLTVDHKRDDDIERLFLLCKEGWAASAIDDYEAQCAALCRFMVGAAILSEEGLAGIRKALQRAADDGIKISEEDVKAVIENEVMKREVLEDPRAEDARWKVDRASKELLKAQT